MLLQNTQRRTACGHLKVRAHCPTAHLHGPPHAATALLQEAAKRVSAQHGHLDLLVNVAGVLHLPGELSPGADHEQRTGLPVDDAASH